MVSKIVQFFVVFLLLVRNSVFAGELRIIFLDVGEGESILVETPLGQAYLIDTGNLITGFRVIQFLKEEGVNEISGLIVTHPHLDHAGGVFYLQQMIKVDWKFDNGEILPLKGLCENFFRWYAAIFRSGKYQTLKAGNGWNTDGVRFEVLWPKRLSGNFNQDSLVMKISYGKRSFLLMGDVGKEVEKILISQYGKALRCDVLKVGHHGADDASSRTFLKTVFPRYAVISINRENLRGYPSRRVLNMLKELRIKTFTTFEHGTILFRTDGDNLWIERKEVWRKKGIHKQHLLFNHGLLKTK